MLNWKELLQLRTERPEVRRSVGVYPNPDQPNGRATVPVYGLEESIPKLTSEESSEEAYDGKVLGALKWL